MMRTNKKAPRRGRTTSEGQPSSARRRGVPATGIDDDAVDLSRAPADLLLGGLAGLPLARALSVQAIRVLAQNRRWPLVWNLGGRPICRAGLRAAMAGRDQHVVEFAGGGVEQLAHSRGSHAGAAADDLARAHRMNALLILIPITLVLATVAVGVFFWAVNDAQFEDLDTPKILPLLDDARKDDRDNAR
jgi:cbb3-type cytochrome oxidase maturation protein